MTLKSANNFLIVMGTQQTNIKTGNINSLYKNPCYNLTYYLVGIILHVFDEKYWYPYDQATDIKESKPYGNIIEKYSYK